MKGGRLRVVRCPRELENGQCVLVGRDNGEKTFVALAELEQKAGELLQSVHDGLFERAKRNLEEHTYAASTLEEAKAIQEEKGGFIKTMWCGELECELKMKEQAGMSSRCMPLQQEKLGEVCACCGKPAKTEIFWGIAY